MESEKVKDTRTGVWAGALLYCCYSSNEAVRGQVRFWSLAFQQVEFDRVVNSDLLYTIASIQVVVEG